MSLTLGEKLRQAREERGISISEVAEQTRISPHYLESIENDEYKTLPGGIFSKGFIKSFAKYVGVDEQEALADYSQMIMSADGEDPDEVKTYRPEVLTDDRSGSMLPTLIFAGIILAMMTGGILFVVNYIQNRGSEADITVSPTPPPANNSDIASNSALPATPAPVTDRIIVELKAIAEPVWTSYSIDGKSNIQTLAADETVKFEANENFKLSYSKAKINNLQIILNGKPFTPPETTKGTIEINIDKANLAELMRNNQASLVATPAAEPATERRPAEADARPTPAATATPETRRAESRTDSSKPAARPTPKITRAAPIKSPTPIIIGRPTAQDNR